MIKPVKSIILVAIMLIAVFPISVWGNGANPSKIVLKFKVGSLQYEVNGISKPIDPGRSTAPEIVDGRVMVPMRCIVEEMGGTIDYGDIYHIAVETICHDNYYINVSEGTYFSITNVTQPSPFSVKPYVKDGRLRMPLRDIGKLMLCNAEWSPENQTVTLTSLPSERYDELLSTSGDGEEIEKLLNLGADVNKASISDFWVRDIKDDTFRNLPKYGLDFKGVSGRNILTSALNYRDPAKTLFLLQNGAIQKFEPTEIEEFVSRDIVEYIQETKIGTEDRDLWEKSLSIIRNTSGFSAYDIEQGFQNGQLGELLKRGLNPNTTSSLQGPLLLRPLFMGPLTKENFSNFKTLIDAGADVNITTDDGANALMVAMGLEPTPLRKQVLDILLPKINLKHRDGSGNNAFFYAKDLADKMMLIEIGAVDSGQNVDGENALFHTTDANCIDKLIQIGVLVDVPDKNGKTALMHHLSEGDCVTAKTLLKNGANINAVDKDGNNAIIYLSWGMRWRHIRTATTLPDNYKECLALIKRYGIDLEHVNKAGERNIDVFKNDSSAPFLEAYQLLMK